MNPPTWKAREGFLCAAAIVGIYFATDQAYWIVEKNNHSAAIWLYNHWHLFEGGMFLAQNSLSLFIVFLFTRTRTVSGFFDKISLVRPMTFPGFLFACAAIGIGFLAIYGSAKQWIPPNHLVRSFYYQGGLSKWFFILYGVVIAPFCEEVVRRGFLYRAFRGSFTVPWSIFFVLCFHAYFHWGLMSHSFFTFLCLALVEILLCLVREWTDSLWNCILCHSVYNATQYLPWYVYTAGLIVSIPYFVQRLLYRCRKGKDEGMHTG